MAKDYEDIDNIGGLSDGELRALLRDRLEEQMAFDSDDVSIAVKDGAIRLSGRVGTEEELRIVEHVVTDVIGIKEVQNDLVVDPIRRAESPVAIDEHLVDEQLHEGILLGDRPRPENPEAEHLHENLRSELFGTTDIQSAIEDGIPWNPPDGPTPDGLSGTDATPNVMGEDH